MVWAEPHNEIHTLNHTLYLHGNYYEHSILDMVLIKSGGQQTANTPFFEK